MKDSRQEMSVFLERQTVRRRKNWTRRLRQVERTLLSVAIVLVGLACLYGLYQMIFLGSTFAIHKIVVEGKWSYLTAHGLGQLAGVKEGDNLFWVRVSDVHERLKSDPWVETTAVQRRLPNTLWIYVEERVPKALLLSNGSLFYVDSNGEVFKRAETGDDKNFPVITGLDLGAEEKLSDEDRPIVVSMLKLIDLFGESNFGSKRDISELNFNHVAGYSVITKKEPAQIVFGFTGFDKQLALLDKMSDAITNRQGRIQYMLANEQGRIIVKFAS